MLALVQVKGKRNRNKTAAGRQVPAVRRQARCRIEKRIKRDGKVQNAKQKNGSYRSMLRPWFPS